MNWQPVETAPKDGVWFMTYSPPDEPGPDADFGIDFSCWVAEYGHFCKVGCGWQYVTHWAPMPEPPAG